MLTIALLLVAGQDIDRLVATARDMTMAEKPCAASADSTDITVCGLRQADRYRVPFVVNDPGDRRHESVAAERERLTHRKNAIETMSAILVETGMAGVSTTIGGGSASPVVTGYRKPAP